MAEKAPAKKTGGSGVGGKGQCAQSVAGLDLPQIGQDIAGPVVFLASPLARHITGEILNVNGGSVLAG